MSSHGNDAIVVSCTEVLFQPSFSLCCSPRCLQSLSSTRRKQNTGRTTRITERDTTQSERALVRLNDTHILDSRLYPKSRKESCTPSMKLSSRPCVVFSRVTRTLTWSTFGFTLRAASHTGVYVDGSGPQRDLQERDRSLRRRVSRVRFCTQLVRCCYSDPSRKIAGGLVPLRVLIRLPRYKC